MGLTGFLLSYVVLLQNRLYFCYKNRVTDVENKLMVTKGERWEG